MFLRSCFLIFSILLASIHSGAQAYNLTLKKTIPVDNGYFTTDRIGNIYLVHNLNLIKKYNADGDSLAVFNDISSGPVTMIDATNPLRLLVFYSGFSQIRILDNLLSQKNFLDLRRIGLFNIPAIANSADGDIWIYDPKGELKKIDDRLEVKHEYPLRIMIEDVVNPCHMVEQDRTLYMTDSMQGILQFDRFGFYRTIYRFKTREATVFNNYIVYYADGKLHSYHTKSMRESVIDIPNPSDILNVRLEKNQIYLLRKNRLEIYTLEQN